MSSRRNRAVMDVPQNSVSHQSSLLFFTAKNDLPVDTHRHLASVWCGRKVYDEMKWFVGSDQNSWKLGQMYISLGAVNQMLLMIRLLSLQFEIIQQDRSVTLDEIFRCLSLNIEASWTTVGKIVSNDLYYQKICVRWVPWFLPDVHKENRFSCCLKIVENVSVGR